MKQKYINIILILVFIISSIFIYFILNNITKEKVELLKQQKYTSISKKLKEQVKSILLKNPKPVSNKAKNQN